jgi:16S rRNA (guanine527-N7)-methyltransferase
MNKEPSQLSEFRAALERNAARYEVQIDDNTLSRLALYYELVQAWNSRLHLVAPCSAVEFATRHVLESLILARHLQKNASLVDVGSGAGLPSIPNLIVRPDTRATLIEASPKKGVFLREALRHCGISEQANVVVERFEKAPAPEAEYVTCRALDRFSEMVPKLIEWAPRPCTFLLFGGDAVRREIEKAGLDYSSVLIPDSERRFVFICATTTNDPEWFSARIRRT